VTVRPSAELQRLAASAVSWYRRARADLDPQLRLMDYLGGFYDAARVLRPAMFDEQMRNEFEKMALRINDKAQTAAPS